MSTSWSCEDSVDAVKGAKLSSTTYLGQGRFTTTCTALLLTYYLPVDDGLAVERTHRADVDHLVRFRVRVRLRVRVRVGVRVRVRVGTRVRVGVRVVVEKG